MEQESAFSRADGRMVAATDPPAAALGQQSIDHDGVTPAVPTPQALFGLACLALSPISILHPVIRYVLAALFVATYVALRPQILDADGGNQLADLQEGERLKRLYLSFVVLFLSALFCSIISAIILLGQGEVQVVELADRGGKQLGSLLLAFMEITCGFHMARHVRPRTVRLVLYTAFWGTILLCVYQNLAALLGLPYIGIYAYEASVGLRPSALTAEPKYLSVYLLGMLALLITDRPRAVTSRLAAFAPRVLGVAAAVYFFVQTSSGNGYSGLAILFGTYFLGFPNPRKALLGMGLALVTFEFLPEIQVSELGLRDTHQGILENLSAFDVRLFDDLIALPMMAWGDNPLSLLIGFGPGLMHFFARRYFDFSTWIEWDTIIEGNIAAIMYISNFGLLLFSTLFVFIITRARRILVSSSGDPRRALHVFFVAIFVLGAIIGANMSVPLFLSIGWILGSQGESEVSRKSPPFEPTPS